MIEHLGQGVVGFGRRQIGYVSVEPLARFLVRSGRAANPSADREAHNAAPEPKSPPLLRAESRRRHRRSGGETSGRVGPKKGVPRRSGQGEGNGKEANECRVGKRFSLFSEEACYTSR